MSLEPAAPAIRTVTKNGQSLPLSDQISKPIHILTKIFCHIFSKNTVAFDLNVQSSTSIEIAAFKNKRGKWEKTASQIINLEGDIWKVDVDLSEENQQEVHKASSDLMQRIQVIHKEIQPGDSVEIYTEMADHLEKRGQEVVLRARAFRENYDKLQAEKANLETQEADLEKQLEQSELASKKLQEWHTQVITAYRDLQERFPATALDKQMEDISEDELCPGDLIREYESLLNSQAQKQDESFESNAKNLQELEQTHNKLKNTHEELLSTLDNLEKARNLSKKRLNQLQALQNQLKVVQEQVKKLQDKGVAEQQLLKVKIQQLENEKGELTETLSKKAKSIISLQTLVSEKEKDIDSLEKNSLETQKHFETLIAKTAVENERKLREKDSAITQLKSTLAQTQSRSTILEESVIQHTMLSKENKALREQNRDYEKSKEKIETLEKEIIRLRTEYDQNNILEDLRKDIVLLELTLLEQENCSVIEKIRQQETNITLASQMYEIVQGIDFLLGNKLFFLDQIEIFINQIVEKQNPILFVTCKIATSQSPVVENESYRSLIHKRNKLQKKVSKNKQIILNSDLTEQDNIAIIKDFEKETEKLNHLDFIVASLLDRVKKEISKNGPTPSNETLIPIVRNLIRQNVESRQKEAADTSPATPRAQKAQEEN